MQRTIAALALSLIAAAALAREGAPHSHAALAQFQMAQPCPATGLTHGACPGWVKDHIVPLCAGGADAPANLQWQTRAASLVKDRSEWRWCRAPRGGLAL